MDTKYLIIGIAAIVVIAAAAGAFVFLQDGEDDSDDSTPDVDPTPEKPKEVAVDKNLKMPDDTNLRIFGNANGDSKMDKSDVSLLKKVVNGDAKQTYWCDFNQDGKINQTDIDLLEKLIDGKEVTVNYINYNLDVCKAKMPITKISVVYYQVLEAVAALGAFDQVVATDHVPFEKIPHLFPGIEKKKDLGNYSTIEPETLMSAGADTIVTGSSKSYMNGMESKLPGDYQIIRLCNGADGFEIVWHMVTLGYLLGCEDQGLAYEKFTNDAVKLVTDRTAKLSDKDKETVLTTCFYSVPKFEIICEHSGTYEASNMAGATNMAKGLYEKNNNSFYYVSSAEQMYSLNPDLLVASLGLTSAGVGFTEDQFLQTFQKAMKDNGLEKLPAYTGGKTLVMSFNIINGIPLGVGLIKLATEFQPELFKDIDPYEYLQKWYDDFTLLDIDVKKDGIWWCDAPTP